MCSELVCYISAHHPLNMSAVSYTGESIDSTLPIPCNSHHENGREIIKLEQVQPKPAEWPGLE